MRRGAPNKKPNCGLSDSRKYLSPQVAWIAKVGLTEGCHTNPPPSKKNGDHNRPTTQMHENAAVKLPSPKPAKTRAALVQNVQKAVVHIKVEKILRDS